MSATGRVVIALIHPDSDRLVASDDQGATWELLGLAAGASVRDVVATNNSLLAATGSGVFASSDNGATWSPRNAGLHAVLVDRLLPIGDGILAVDQTAGLFRSMDGGQTWRPVNDGVPVAVT